MTPAQIPVKDRRKELILIAYNHIAKRGFEGLRVRNVATEAGINNATLHYYFPTKEDLIKGVVDSMIEKFAFAYSLESAAPESADALIEMHSELEDARHLITDLRDQIIVFSELLVRSLRDPALAQIFKKFDESWRGYLVGLIERGKHQGVFGAELDPTVTATLIMLQLKGFGYHMLGETNPAIAGDVFDQLVLQIETWISAKSRSN